MGNYSNHTDPNTNTIMHTNTHTHTHDYIKRMRTCKKCQMKILESKDGLAKIMSSINECNSR
jgi:hypothetical protein